MATKESTEQVSVTPPEQRNPTGKGGFGDNPQNRNPGGWKKEHTISYQYRRYMSMSEAEFTAAADEPDRTMAMVIAYNRVKEAKKSLYDVKEISDRTEGKAPQFIGVGDPDDVKKALVEFIDDGSDTTDSQDSDTKGV